MSDGENTLAAALKRAVEKSEPEKAAEAETEPEDGEDAITVALGDFKAGPTPATFRALLDLAGVTHSLGEE
jgi:hypothetical protein